MSEDAQQTVKNALKALTEYSQTLDEAIEQWEATAASDAGSLQPIEKTLLTFSFAAFRNCDQTVQRAVSQALLVRLLIDTGGETTEDDKEMSRLMTEVIPKVERCDELRKQIKEKHGV